MNIVEKRANYLMACFYHQEHTQAAYCFVPRCMAKVFLGKVIATTASIWRQSKRPLLLLLLVMDRVRSDPCSNKKSTTSQLLIAQLLSY